jgi:hypothetical protein
MERDGKRWKEMERDGKRLHTEDLSYMITTQSTHCTGPGSIPWWLD